MTTRINYNYWRDLSAMDQEQNLNPPDEFEEQTCHIHGTLYGGYCEYCREDALLEQAEARRKDGNE